MLACSFLIESSTKLLVTRTDIKARSSSILGRIRWLILELLALEWRKFHTFELEYHWSQLASLLSNFMCSIIGVGERLHKVLGQIDLGILDSGEQWLPFGLLVFFFVKCIFNFIGKTRFRRDMLSCDSSYWFYLWLLLIWMKQLIWYWVQVSVKISLKYREIYEERNPFLVCGKTWLIISLRALYLP